MFHRISTKEFYFQHVPVYGFLLNMKTQCIILSKEELLIYFAHFIYSNTPPHPWDRFLFWYRRLKKIDKCFSVADIHVCSFLSKMRIRIDAPHIQSLFKDRFLSLIREFSQCTSMHGLKYVGEEFRLASERFLVHNQHYL